MEKKEENPYVGIAGAVGGLTVAMVAIIAIFANQNIWVVAPVVASMSLLGILLGYFASKKR